MGVEAIFRFANIVLLTIALSALLPYSARAALVCDTTSCTDTASFSGVVTDLHGVPLRVSKFDLPSNFVLQRVLVQLSGGMATGGFITNNSPNTANFYYQMFAAEYSATGVGGIEVLPQTQNVLNPWTSIHGPQFYNDVASGETVQFGPGSASSGARTLIDSTDVEIISQFVDDNSSGTDQFGYDFSSEIATSFSGGGGNFIYDISTTADAELSVTYFYELNASPDELPAPGGLGFVLLGLMAIGAARRRLIR